MKLGELSLRQPGFKPGVPVVLGDGQVWQFPRPSLNLFPVLGDDGTFKYDQCRWSYEAKVDELVDAYMAATTFIDEANAILGLAVAALSRNYQLDAQAVRQLLPRIIDDPVNEEMWDTIKDIVLGRSPKPTASGSGS